MNTICSRRQSIHAKRICDGVSFFFFFDLWHNKEQIEEEEIEKNKDGVEGWLCFCVFLLGQWSSEEPHTIGSFYRQIRQGRRHGNSLVPCPETVASISQSFFLFFFWWTLSCVRWLLVDRFLGEGEMRVRWWGFFNPPSRSKGCGFEPWRLQSYLEQDAPCTPLRAY